jgi:hypothetical protein
MPKPSHQSRHNSAAKPPRFSRRNIAEPSIKEYYYEKHPLKSAAKAIAAEALVAQAVVAQATPSLLKQTNRSKGYRIKQNFLQERIFRHED